jgi:hypothetical protein
MVRCRISIEIDNCEEFYKDIQIHRKGNFKRILEDAYKEVKDKIKFKATQ